MKVLEPACEVGTRRRLRRQQMTQDGLVLGAGAILFVDCVQHEPDTIRYFLRGEGLGSLLQMTQRTFKAETRGV